MMAMAKKQVDNFRANLGALCSGYGAVTSLATHLGVHRVTMSKILHGHQGIELEQAEAIADFYGVALADMLMAPGNFKKTLQAS
jgi:hypothetical protein